MLAPRVILIFPNAMTSTFTFTGPPSLACKFGEAVNENGFSFQKETAPGTARGTTPGHTPYSHACRVRVHMIRYYIHDQERNTGRRWAPASEPVSLATCVGLCRFGEAWAALRAENLLTYFTPPQHSVSTTHSTYLKRSLLTEGTWSLEQTLGHDVPTTREELVLLPHLANRKFKLQKSSAG